MISYTLNIADYNILLQSRSDSVRLSPSAAQLSFISETDKFDIALNISKAKVKIHPGMKEVFKAPYIEEINGVQVKKSNKFWTVYKQGDYIIIHSTMPLSENASEALLVIRPGEKGWDLIIDTDSNTINPLEYPIDGLLLYYLTALNGDIFIHGSGIYFKDKGLLFTGPSGRGKTTMARIFNDAGAKVVHDDRLIIRKTARGYTIYNTPVYNDELSSSCPIHAIYMIEHSKSNKTEVPGNVEALSLIMSNCIQHHWNSSLIGVLTGSIMDLCENIDVRKLGFFPDKKVISHIINE